MLALRAWPSRWGSVWPRPRTPRRREQDPRAQDRAAEAKRDDPKARALFDEVSKAYKALTSYSDKGEFVVAMTIGGKTQKQAMPLKLTFVRPNKVDIDAGQVRLIERRHDLTTTVVPLKRYTTRRLPEN